MSRAPKVHAIRADISKRKARREAFQHAVEHLGTVDILINSAGIAPAHPAIDFPMEVWDHAMELNLTAVFDLCQLAAKMMLAKGRGKIINIGSLHSILGKRELAVYAASKGGVALVTKSLAHEWSHRGINVNAVIPGWIETEMSAAFRNDPVEYPKTLDRLPMRRWGTPEDLKGVFVFLASRASDYITGELLAVDGGMLAI